MVNIISVGQNVVDMVSKVSHLPGPDEKVYELKPAEMFVGGVESNYLAAASKLGESVGFICAIGNDNYADFILEKLKEESIDMRYAVMKESNSPLNKLTVDETGQKTIVLDGLMKELRPEVSDMTKGHEEYIASAKLLHTSAIHVDASEWACRVAKNNGVRVSIDLETQVINDGRKRGDGKLENMLYMADILMPNKDGARMLSGENDLGRAAKNIFDKYEPEIVVVTLGEEGCLITTKERQLRVPAYKVSVVDTTGAGDTFNAAFTIGYLKEWSLERIGRFANASAALKVTKLGARPGMPCLKEVEDFLSGNPEILIEVKKYEV